MHKVNDMNEKRKYRRVIFYTEADYGFNGKITDISLGGAYIETYTPLPEKSIINVKFQFPEGKDLVLKAVVKSSKQGMGMGIEFIELKEDDEAALLDFINAN
ncbi:MAG: hypothetical protein A2Y62_21570 [Candidatus Fischerbacteria bacterium RBG_13_37_8]|uniref:PilZ domain-containing protein n=1 Tax=Candidatus Fischerbacteria bacterium RBG_13_37_8 TaxID=1817863 RepID=A0A1F5VK42_9BACT|nr:MAG: hypothetical protein A2Y62_21570 [Candidatus Fischerbacteria bacterium RBG_13_37_8]